MANFTIKSGVRLYISLAKIENQTCDEAYESVSPVTVTLPFGMTAAVIKGAPLEICERLLDVENHTIIFYKLCSDNKNFSKEQLLPQL